MYLQAAKHDHSLGLEKGEETFLQSLAKPERKGVETQRSEKTCLRIQGSK